MAERRGRGEPSVLRTNHCYPSERDINILLLGQTGVGKTTFINAFANYITNDTLEQAEQDEMQVVIPFSFAYNSEETFDETMITVGRESEHEKFVNFGESNTQQCRSFVFPIGTQNLRFIDTPGVGDTRGLEQDVTNFQEILNYIAQYEHLNGVCILLKPNEERMTVLFRFCINELLRHLHVSARENIVFVFTNSRSTFFKPGASKKLLQGLLDQHKREHQVIIPFNMTNSFLLDNEPFRYLALRKNNISLDEDQAQAYDRSWNVSVKEYSRLMEYIISRPLHAISNTLSLNEAEQLVRKLARPIAETTKLIEQNIELAKEYKNKVLTNPQMVPVGIPQNNPVVQPLKYPRTVCVGEKCCRVTKNGDEVKMEYLHICHDNCFLKGVEQEKLFDPKLEDCTVMNFKTGKCTICGCHWSQHKHITYEYTITRSQVESSDSTSKKPMTLADIDRRIDDLEAERQQVQEVYGKLVAFLRTNSVLPINNEIVGYLDYFIREEEMKQNSGDRNANVIDGLKATKDQYKQDMELLEKTLKDQRTDINQLDIPKPEDIFTLVGTLYQLPISGKQIREQVNGVRLAQAKCNNEREVPVSLPSKAATSKVMEQMKKVISTG